jgi:hypothetical protein
MAANPKIFPHDNKPLLSASCWPAVFFFQSISWEAYVMSDFG